MLNLRGNLEKRSLGVILSMCTDTCWEGIKGAGICSVVPSAISLCRDIQNTMRHSPGLPNLADSAWVGGDGLDNLRRCLPTSTTLRFFETNLWNKHLLLSDFSLICSKHCAGFAINPKTIKEKYGRFKQFREFFIVFLKLHFWQPMIASLYLK